MKNGNGEKVIDKGIEVDSDVSLMKVFNWINTDKTSQVFVYKDVQF